MGGAFPSTGNDSDQTNGITPITQLDGTGLIYGTSTKLPYTVKSGNFNPANYNGENVAYQAYHTPIPKIWQWNFALQREVMPNTVVELAYVASHGYALVFPTDLNAIPQSKLSSNDSPQYRPYPNYQGIPGSSNNAVSNYNSLQASVTKRMSSGVSLSFNYVWSLGREPIRPKLAVSLNASTEESRQELMPITRKYHLRDLMEACRAYPLRPWEKLTFEYVLLKGVNDTDADARRVVKLLANLNAKVNLIALNPGPGIPY